LRASPLWRAGSGGRQHLSCFARSSRASKARATVSKPQDPAKHIRSSRGLSAAPAPMKRESPAAAARSSGQSWRPAARVKVNHYAATSAAIMLLCRSDLVSRHQAALPARNSIRFRGRPTPAATWSGQSKAGSNLYNWPQLAAQSQSERPQPRRPVGVQRAATADLPSNCLAGSNLTRNSICSNPKSGRLLAGARNHPRQVRPRAPDAGRDLQEAERRVAQGKVSWTRVVAGQLGGPQTGERSAHSIVRSPPPPPPSVQTVCFKYGNSSCSKWR